MKEDLRLKKIRDYLLKNEKATPTQIGKGTNIRQSKQLSADLQKLNEQKEITWEPDPKDRRKKWYSLKNRERSIAESKRYDSLKFIENLKDPFYYEATVQEDGYRVLLSYFMEGPAISGEDQDIKQTMQEMLEAEAKVRFFKMKIEHGLEFQLAKKTVWVTAYEVPEEKVKEDFDKFKEQIKGRAMLRKEKKKNECKIK